MPVASTAPGTPAYQTPAATAPTSSGSPATQTSASSASSQHQISDTSGKPLESSEQVLTGASSLQHPIPTEPGLEETLPQREIPDPLPVPSPNFIHTETGTKYKSSPLPSGKGPVEMDPDTGITDDKNDNPTVKKIHLERIAFISHLDKCSETMG